MNLYLIGQITGIENNNRPEFERVRWTLLGNPEIDRAAIPHDSVSSYLDWNIATARSITTMLKIEEGSLFYDGIAMLDGWENSKGATIEHDLAVKLGIPCKPWKEWLEDANE